ncbi:AAA family ATPase [Alkalinema sp. FACHB-956]|uniref:AAA family ATPase n=1 Tax=Alkalinema sp. FACHB-956 TaxID=2692768 RepID=UPI001685A638|nr:AAA family ATPase [Alkalinema sp. FACHB-956]MBD2326127.1 AAA family ATPase [Alkalinema sp. FACHB-956]
MGCGDRDWIFDSASAERPLLVILVGLPGSGKSTIAQQFVDQTPSVRVISTDGIRAQLFGDESIQGPWLKIWLEIRQQFLQATVEIQQGGRSFAVFDATNAVRKHRRAAIALARKCGFVTVGGLWVATPLPVCLDRNQARSRQVPEAVIERMTRRLYGAPPQLEDGFDHLWVENGFG